MYIFCLISHRHVSVELYGAIISFSLSTFVLKRNANKSRFFLLLTINDDDVYSEEY